MITLEDAKVHLGITGDEDDLVVEALVDSAVAAMGRCAGRRLKTADVVEILDGSGGRFVWLGEPAESVTTVHVSSTQEWVEGTLLDAENYRVVGCKLERLSYGFWYPGQSNVRVAYKAGYAAPPDDLAQACRMQVGVLYAEWQRSKAGLDNVASEGLETWKRQFLPRYALDPAVEGVCERHRAGRL